MAHVYATVDGFKRHAVDTASDFGTATDAGLRALLEAVSASIDEFCERTDADHVTSGFGPRTGTNRYDGPSSADLALGDDLLSITSVTVIQGLGGDGVVYADETDFYRRPYDRAPYRELALNGLGQASWYDVPRGISVAGSWGYQDVRESLGTLGAAIATTTATSCTVTGAEAGMTLLVDSEQIYVSAVSGTTATIARGQNGTTAATHANGATVERYVYPGPVGDACLQVAMRRRRSRDAGLTPDYGGGPVPIATNRDTERAILREILWPYALRRLT